MIFGFIKWSLLRRKDYASEFVRAVRAEDEFELEENRISFALREEIVRLQEVVVVLQPEF